MQILKESDVAGFIANSQTAVIMAVAANCAACDKYKLVVEELEPLKIDSAFGSILISRSQKTTFTAKYMKSGADNVPLGTPMIFVFKDGVLAYRRFGLLTLRELSSFIDTGEIIAPDPIVIEERLSELDALVGRSTRETNKLIQDLQMAHQELLTSCNAEIKRLNEVSDGLQ